jgi:RHS repeat-associated protein
MRKIALLSGLLLSSVLFASTASSQQPGRMLYVSNTDPSCKGNFPCYPTIQTGVNAAFPGDTIQVQAGLYRERLAVDGKNNFSGAMESARIVIEADPALSPGGVVVKPPAASCLNGQAVLIRRSRFITLRGLTITGATGAGIVLLGGVQQNQAIHIERSRIVANGSPSCPSSGISIALGNPDTLVVNTLIHGNQGNGITFTESGGGPHSIIQNTIHRNGWNGVGIVLGHTILLANNVITGNGQATGTLGGRHGVHRLALPGQDPDAVQLLNNLVCGNRLGEIQGAILDGEDSGNLTPRGSEGTGVTASAGCGVAANVYGDLDGPDNVSSTIDDDFSLAAKSPAIDSGVDPRKLGLTEALNTILEADYDSPATRPSDGNADRDLRFDIGALELSNQRPLAHAGTDQSVTLGSRVILNGSQSRDPEGASLTYLWTILAQPPGSAISLSNPTSVSAEFTPVVFGNYSFQLVVDDGELKSAPDTVEISMANRSPTASAGGPYTGMVGVPLQFAGSGGDPDGDGVTFNWNFGDGGTASGARPTHTYEIPGIFTVTLTVNDSRGAFATAQASATVTASLILNPIGNKTVNLGETLAFTVTANNPGGQPVSLFVAPLPLPNHATFNAATGLFTFRPDTRQVGSFPLTFSATGGANSVSETITVTVASPPPNGVTAVRGRVYNLNNSPLGNVKVTLRSSGHTSFSGSDGYFTISGIPSGRQELIVNGREAHLGVFAILAVSVDLLAGVLNNLASPITLPDVDVLSEVPVNPTFTTVVTNDSLPGVELTILSGTARNSDGTPFTGKLSINPVPDYGRPESRPEELRPGTAITIQPAGIRFDPPARLTFPNADGMPPGSELNLWSLSPDTGTFSIVGKGVVTSDAQSIITVEGGVTASAWHFPLAASGSSNTDVDESEGLTQLPDKQCMLPVGSTVALQNGCLGVEFALPSYRSMGVSRTLKFIYKSNRAKVFPSIPFNATIPIRAAVPPKLSYSLSVGGLEVGTETFINTSALDENRDEIIRAVASFDASQLKTGVYPYRIKLTSNYLNSAISSFISDRVLVVNEHKSTFGAGWGIEGLGRMHFNADGTVVLTEGNGAAVFFFGGPHTFTSGSGDFSTLSKNPDDGFTRILKDGTKINFNSQGLQSSVVDRNGNATSYTYDGSGRLSLITDPAKLVTTFSYAGDRVSSISDPAGRTTSFQHDGQGNLISVHFPDGSSKSFGYDSRHLMTSEVDERGFVVQREYDSIGRLVRATLPDGSMRAATDAQTVGFVDPSTGVGTITNPAPAARPADALSTFADGRGNQQVIKIGRFGAPLRIRDSLGQSTVIERDHGNNGSLLGGTNFASGQIGEAFSFDGIDDFVQLSNNLYNPFPATGFTYSFWINPFDTPSGRSRNIISNHHAGGNWWNGISLTSGTIELVLQNAQTGGAFIWSTTNTLVLSRWYHVAVAYRNQGSLTTDATIYINGAPQALNAFKAGGSTDYTVSFAPGYNASDSMGLAIGRLLEDSPRAHFNGLVDEFQLYNRTLSAEEIRTIFSAGIARNSIFLGSGLVGFWSGNGDATDTANGHGLPAKITGPNGAVTAMTYDSKGNLLTSTDPIGATTTFTYEPNFNQVKTIRDSKGNTTTINYDVKGNPIEIIDASGSRSQMTYDSRGLLTSVTSGVGTPVQNTTSFTYNARGNLLTLTDPRNNVTTLTYDSAGNVIRATDAEGRVTEFTYDVMNRLGRVLDGNAQQTNYAYDPKGNLTQVIDAKNRITRFDYDQRDRLSAATNPSDYTETFVYDGNGNLISTTNRNGESIAFSYDALNRLISKSRPPTSAETGSQVTNYGYDSVGNLTSVFDSDSTITNVYDLANRLTSMTSSTPSMPPETVLYDFDLNGNRSSMTDPEGGVTDYTYDSLNRLTSVTDPALRTTSFDYDALGRRTLMRQANNVTTSYSYDAASQLTRLAHQLGATTINSFDYTYDKVGNKKTKLDRNGSYNYTYDALDRLTQALNPLPSNPMESYVYDAVGNRTNSNQNGLSIFNQANQLTEDTDFSYRYDNNGNMIRKTTKVGGAFTTFEYDAENKLVRVIKNGRTVNYRYDGLGRRIEKEVVDVGTTTTRYIYDNEDILLELNASNNIVARYTHGPGIDEPLIMEKNNQSFFYHIDGLGSISEITNHIGNVTQRYTYSSFGKIESELDLTFVQPYAYTSREHDPETGMYHYRARTYDSSNGRFLQQDPLWGSALMPNSQNRYPYVANSPLNFVDPSGRVLLIVSPALGIIGAGMSLGYDVLQGRPIDWPQAIASGLTASIVGGPIFTQVITSALTSGIQVFFEEYADCKPGIDLKRVLLNSAIEGVYGRFSPRLQRPDFAKLFRDFKNPYDYERSYRLLAREFAGQQFNTVAYEGLSQGAQRGIDTAYQFLEAK